MPGLPLVYCLTPLLSLDLSFLINSLMEDGLGGLLRVITIMKSQEREVMFRVLAFFAQVSGEY